MAFNDLQGQNLHNEMYLRLGMLAFIKIFDKIRYYTNEMKFEVIFDFVKKLRLYIVRIDLNFNQNQLLKECARCILA